MLLVTRGAGTILHHVRFVKAVLLMTRLAFAINRFDRDTVTKPVPQDFAEFSASNRAVMTLRAVVREL